MVFSSLIRTLQKSPLTKELLGKLKENNELGLKGINRLPKGLVSSALAQSKEDNLLVICATLEEAGRWTAQLEIMGWQTVNFYPTSEASPYEPLNPESEMVWGQMQVLSNLNRLKDNNNNYAIVTTEKALQPHLIPPDIFHDYCLNIQEEMTEKSKEFDEKLVRLGYERVNLVEVEGQWSRRGDIVDIFPVSSEIPIRLEWFGDELEKIREFDPSTQRSLDKLEQILLTPIGFNTIIANKIKENNYNLDDYLSEQEKEGIDNYNYPPGMQRFLGIAFEEPSSILDYLEPNTLCVFDEIEQCRSHSDRWLDYIEEQWENNEKSLPKVHRSFDDSFQLAEKLPKLYLYELSEVNNKNALDLSSRPLPTTPHQFAKLAEILRGKREIYSGMSLNKYATWLISAQPSRTVSLLQEHDCQAQFIPNPRDYPAINKSHIQDTAIALKYSGLAELEGFILPTFRIVVVTDKEFFGQHVLATAGYIRKRRRATSKKVDLQQLHQGDYVVHKSHGIGKFLKLESLATREYLVVQYEDGILRIPADSFDSVSRYRHTESKPPKLHKMTGKTWQKSKQKVRKNIRKLAVDLINLYAKRAKNIGFTYPLDTPWQQELEDSFPYQPTPDQLKAIQEVKIDLESDRPMDRLVCGDVGFGKTEVAVRAIFKAVTSGHKQVVFLAPTTILTQQHYHTLKERFAPYPINIGLLNRFRTASEKKEIIQRLSTGELDIVVGSQQLLGKSFKFNDLGLLVIDEEQRFGVNQKEKIKDMKSHIDVLTLSATPIPRTLYMSLSGIREMSLITTPPPSRRPIKTHLSRYNPDAVRTAIRNELDRGGQVFYVVPRVEGIEEVAAQIKRMVPSARMAIGHGQMDVNELEMTMLGFNNGDADILVCTTIVESGLDIPRVNTIIVEDAQKFGLAQLYQLRGRVGRAGIQAHAWLLYPSKSELTETARKRLRALQEFSQLGSGYQLATRDMEIRGVGNLLGAEQSGQMESIGFELYMEMLQESIREIQGQEIPKVEDTQVDLQLTAFIPTDYIPDMEQKMSAYRAIAVANSQKELSQIAAEWSDRYGKLPVPVQQLLQVIELKQLAKSLGFSRIKPEGKQHIVLETPMEEPAWKLLQEKIPEHLRSRFVYSPKKVTVRGLGVMKPQKQLESLLEWLEKMQDAIKVDSEK
ncbi:MAG: transcription-repair coupling factor [Crocosphaera sp.]|uniref:Transcription-repair-coupling factor n=5 Tax=Crocosphaera watsonii TaxID=263511 RepID=T2JNH5_CROWT|nr:MULTISPECIES: transcription-repair coupling factor [Crocosphaera]MCH2244358.1 transcription-repair coupling factor [Crocosphaera sp.]NQZ63623.1 transcription-repair coupling factor [Crocosphaera sp.]CCQ57096.1 Transcription-repair coupling factor [Crocosphaera watsonii WH 0005]CCQ66589.1 Transcription-repair coupling factor [Crocosphaera watsonii WH 0402]